VSRPRLTIRVRLTLLYTGLFAAGGSILVAITYALVAALPVAGDSTTVQLPNGADTLSYMVPDRQTLEPICRRALTANVVTDQNLEDKCVAAYRISAIR